MESLIENKPMLYSVIGSGFGVFLLAANVMPEMNEKFQLVELPDEVSIFILIIRWYHNQA